MGTDREDRLGVLPLLGCAGVTNDLEVRPVEGHETQVEPGEEGREEEADGHNDYSEPHGHKLLVHFEGQVGLGSHVGPGVLGVGVRLVLHLVTSAEVVRDVSVQLLR